MSFQGTVTNTPSEITMAKEYYVLREDRATDDDDDGVPKIRVIFEWGHYDQEGAQRTMRQDAQQHPRAVYHIVKIVESFQFPEKAQ